jgi:hypothetical protein
MHSCGSIVTLNDFTLLTSTYGSKTIQRERMVAIPRQQWLREGAVMLLYTYIACLVLASFYCGINLNLCSLVRFEVLEATIMGNEEAVYSSSNAQGILLGAADS